MNKMKNIGVLVFIIIQLQNVCNSVLTGFTIELTSVSAISAGFPSQQNHVWEHYPEEDVHFVLIPRNKQGNTSNVYLTYHNYEGNTIPIPNVQVGETTKPCEQVTTSRCKFILTNDERLKFGEHTNNSIHILFEQSAGIILTAKFDGFAPLSILDSASLGKEYKVITSCKILGKCFISVSAVDNFKSIRVEMILPDVENVQVYYRGGLYKKGQMIHILLSELEVVSLECKCDLTGTIIKSNDSLAVFSGARQTVIRIGKRQFTYMAQMPPVNIWGKELFVVDSEVSALGDFIQVLARYDNTTVEMDGFPIVQIENSDLHWIQRTIPSSGIVHILANKPILVGQIIADGTRKPAMIISPPIDHYLNTTFNFPCNYQGFVVYKGNSDIDIGVSTISSTVPISKSGFGAYRLSCTCETHNVTSCVVTTNGNPFTLFYTPLDNPSYTGVQYATLYSLKSVLETKEMVPGDGVDNDNDGEVDEDDCVGENLGFELSSISSRIPSKANFEDAKQYCASISMTLAKINTAEQYDKAVDILQQYGTSRIFIGYTKAEITHVSFLSTKWQPGEPNGYDNNEDCVEVNHRDGLLNDISCNMLFSYLCFQDDFDGSSDVSGLDCMPTSFGQVDNIGNHFVFPIWQISGDNTQIQLTLTLFPENKNMILFRNGTKLDDNILPTETKNMYVASVYSQEEFSATIIMRNNNNTKAISTLLYPTDTWGPTYYAASYSSIDSVSFCTVTAYSNTDIQIIFADSNFLVNLTLDGNTYYETNKLLLEMKLRKFTFALISSTEDLTGTFIKATNPVSVICGAYNDQYSIAEQILPVRFYSSGIFSHLFQLYEGDRVSEYKVRVLTGSDFTTCWQYDNDGVKSFEYLENKGAYFEEEFSSGKTKVSCNKPVFVWSIIMWRTGSGSMIINPNESQLKPSYNWSIHDQNADNFLQGTELYVYGFAIDNTTLQLQSQNIVFNEGRLALLNNGHQYTAVTLKEPDSPFFLWIVGLINNFYFATHVGMALKDDVVCILGDGNDSDCDGTTMEELCTLEGYNYVPSKYLLHDDIYIPDYDLDGNYDEDCLYTVPACEDPTKFYNNSRIIGNYQGNRWNVATWVLMGCNERFSLFGTRKIYCLSDSTWATDKFTCMPDCEDPVTVYPNSFIMTNTSWAIGGNVSMGCKEEFSLFGDNLITCLNTSTWETVRFVCAPDCEDPVTSYPNSLIITNTSWAIRRNVSMGCEEKFSLIGDNLITCLNTSTWETERFVCAPDCEDPVTSYPNSLIITNTSWAIGGNVSMGCEEEFSLIGDNLITCLNTSTWETERFDCAPVIECEDPSPLVNNSKLLDPMKSRPVNSTHKLICEPGYSVRGNSTITCLSNASWSNPEFECVEGCSDPRLSTNHSVIINYIEGTPFLRDDIITMACETSTTRIGGGQMKCLRNKQWNKNISCIPDCPDPREILKVRHARIKAFTSQSSTAYGVSYEFRCKMYYTMFGNEFKTSCQKNSTWSPVNFECRTCKCICRNFERKAKYEDADLTENVQTEIQMEQKKKLATDPKSMSAFSRTKISAVNKEEYATSIGVIGILILTVFLGSILAFDVIDLIRFINQKYTGKLSKS